ncbi:MAG: TetR/AcrR family transcriptional regulator [Bacteroidota bacterium]
MNARPRSQDKLVDTALELFAENGYPAVTEEDLLKASKVSRGILMYHFGNKSRLLEEIVRKHQTCIQETLPPLEKKEQLTVHVVSPVDLIDCWTHSLQRYPTWWKCYFRLIQYPESRAIIEADPIYTEVVFQSRTYLQAYFTTQGVLNVPVEIALFQSFRTGISVEYLNRPKTFPLGEVVSVWKAKYLDYK